MSKQIGLVANLDLCMGCYACEVACKQEHDFSEGKKGIKVMTFGPYENEGELTMDFVPMGSDICDLCADRRAAGDGPFCAQICPTKALTLQTDDEILRMMRSKDRFHICKVERLGDG